MTVREWMDQGTDAFLKTLDNMSDGDLDNATPLPGWTGKDLVAHVHYNALALRRLVTWAATGVETHMYDSSKQRTDEIVHGQLLPALELRRLVRESVGELSSALDSLSVRAWQAKVVTAQGRTVPATTIPWMRTREVFVHAIDLGGITFDDLPGDVVTELLRDVVTKRAFHGEGSPLVAWLTGRSDDAPTLGPWL